MKTLLFILTSAVLLSACKKKDNLPVNKYTGDRVKSDITINGIDTASYYTYEYDDKGRLVKELNKKTGGYATYTYSANSVSLNSFTANGQSNGSSVFELNSQGMAFKRTYPSNGNVQLYEYNSDGYLIRMTTSNPTEQLETINYYNAFKWLDSSVYTVSGTSSSWTKTVYDQYIPGKNYSIRNAAFGISWQGETVTGVYQQNRSTNSFAPTVSGHDRLYEFDSKGRITRVTTVSFPTGPTSDRYFTYY